MDERRGMLMEFLVLAGLLIGMVVALVVLTVAGYAASEVAGTLGHLVETGFGAIIALAYAARGLSKSATVIEPGPGTQTATVIKQPPA